MRKLDPRTPKCNLGNWRIVLLFVLAFLVCAPYSTCQTVSNKTNQDIVLPEGFSAVVVTDAIGQGRHLAVNSNGDIYVSLNHLKNKCGIAALRNTNKDGKADIIKYFGKYSGTGNGIVSHCDGMMLPIICMQSSTAVINCTNYGRNYI